MTGRSDARPDVEPRLLARRRLLRDAFWTGLSGATAAALLGLLRYVWPGEDGSAIVSVPANEIPRPGDDPRYFPAATFFLVNLRPGEGLVEPSPSFQFSYPPGTRPSEKGGILALHSACTHLGCTVP